MNITESVFRSFILCPTKAYLLSEGQSGTKSEYEVHFNRVSEKYCADAIQSHNVVDSPFSQIDGKAGKQEAVLYRTTFESNGMSASSVIERVSGGSALGSFHYVPVTFSSNGVLSVDQRMILAYRALVLESIQSRRPEFGRVICGNSFKKTRISDQIEKARKIIASIKKLETSPPRLMLNRHCHICEFASTCRVKAIEKDDLSLLAGIPPKEIETQNKRGIFTVTQFSYTFRPRKKFRKSYPFNLKALALREKKIHLYGTPSLPAASVQIYLDVEGDPNRDFYYLIGVVIVENGIERKHSFWADSEAEERESCLEFVNCIRGYVDYKIYHYGSYETKFLQRVKIYVDTPDDTQTVDLMIKNAVNVLTVVYEHVFFPIYSNGLKDVGVYLGFEWTTEVGSGINSLVWRAKFEKTKDEFFKKKLMDYNLDDCVALKRVADSISQITKVITGEGMPSVDFIQADTLKAKSLYKWGIVDFALKDMERINRCAYFDYQREKVFIRTDKKAGKADKCRTTRRRHRVSKEVIVTVPKKCPYCKKRLYKNEHFAKTVFDLKFTDSGVRREVTVYRTSQMRCPRCTKVLTTPDEYKAVNRYGHGLISFVVYYAIEWHMPYDRIEKMLFDLFGFFRKGMGKKLKDAAVEYYQETSQRILQRILSGKFIHIDETKINVGKVNGYVWVFSTMNDVYFMFTPTREGDFLREMLAGYSGVIISDFYAAYCYQDWVQQKCLVHLIRDLNDDLRSAPFDNEYKKMTEDFTILLREMIDTIDKYGLKRRYLAKHKKGVARFFRDIGRNQFQSDLAQKYQKRFLKNENTLFTFLDYDGVPWNNNNAEHAIKHFAVYRNGITRFGGPIKEGGLKSHLALLSIYQTCRYRGINFLKFLVSKEKDMDRFASGRTVC